MKKDVTLVDGCKLNGRLCGNRLIIWVFVCSLNRDYIPTAEKKVSIDGHWIPVIKTEVRKEFLRNGEFWTLILELEDKVTPGLALGQ